MADPAPPDTDAALDAWLKQTTQPWYATVGGRVGADLTSPEAALRYAYVDGGNLANGGGTVWVQYQVEGWGPSLTLTEDDGTANTLARQVHAAASDFYGLFSGTTVSGATAQPPRPVPDPVTNRPRWIVDLIFTAAP
jgi:hypothetical protein